jgi:hypothetical protein
VTFFGLCIPQIFSASPASTFSHHNHATQPPLYRVQRRPLCCIFDGPGVCTAMQAHRAKSTTPSPASFSQYRVQTRINSAFTSAHSEEYRDARHRHMLEVQSHGGFDCWRQGDKRKIYGSRNIRAVFQSDT